MQPMRLDSALIILIVSSFCVSLLVLCSSLGLLRRYFADVPNDRSLHEVIKPRAGGLAFAVSFFLAITANELLERTHRPLTLSFFLLGVGPLVLIGLLDDARSLPRTLRLVIQLTCAAIIVHTLQPLDFASSYVPTMLLAGVAALAIMSLVNFYNFMDGIDGLVASCSMVQLVFFYWAFGEESALLLCSATAGFLVLNWPPSKVFMGDCGSTLLGAAVAIFVLCAKEFSIFTNCAVVTLPITGDAVYTLIRRALRKENIFKAHREHIYQRLVRSGLSHRAVTLTYIALSIALAVLCAFNWTVLAGLLCVSSLVAAERYLLQAKRTA